MASLSCTQKLGAILILSFLTLSSLSSMTRATRDSLLTRLKLHDEGGTSSSCWDSLLELQACSGEAVLFFINDETYLGPQCCNAIRIIQHQCWPSMMVSLGFTQEEGDVLRGYCDATASNDNNDNKTPPKGR